ncbi:hypothetical protein [Halobellus rufus]|nr:hypothetical protein [Halobellus rufus]
MLRRVRTQVGEASARWRRRITAADRGWKATALGVAIVLLTVSVF